MSTALAEIESLSRGLRRSAGQGDWQAVQAALTERDRLVRELLAGPDAAGCAGALRRMLDGDREVVTLARDARDAVAAELRKLDDGRKAVHAYGGGVNRQSRRSIATASTADPDRYADAGDETDGHDSRTGHGGHGGRGGHDRYDSHGRLDPLEA